MAIVKDASILAIQVFGRLSFLSCLVPVRGGRMFGRLEVQPDYSAHAGLVSITTGRLVAGVCGSVQPRRYLVSSAGLSLSVFDYWCSGLGHFTFTDVSAHD